MLNGLTSTLVWEVVTLFGGFTPRSFKSFIIIIIIINAISFVLA